MARKPHDRFFRIAFGHARDTAAWLKDALPTALADELAWDDFALVSGDQPDEGSGSTRGDLTFRTTLRGEPTLVFILLEHQRRTDRYMAVRLMTYTLQQLRAWMRENPNATELPIILSVVVHQGPGPWTAPLDVRDAVPLPGELRLTLGPYLLGQRNIVLDLQRQPGLLEAGPAQLRVATRLLAHRGGKGRVALLRAMRDDLKQAFHDRGPAFRDAVQRYTPRIEGPTLPADSEAFRCVCLSPMAAELHAPERSCGRSVYGRWDGFCGRGEGFGGPRRSQRPRRVGSSRLETGPDVGGRRGLQRTRRPARATDVAVAVRAAAWAKAEAWAQAGISVSAEAAHQAEAEAAASAEADLSANASADAHGAALAKGLVAGAIALGATAEQASDATASASAAFDAAIRASADDDAVADAGVLASFRAQGHVTADVLARVLANANADAKAEGKAATDRLTASLSAATTASAGADAWAEFRGDVTGEVTLNGSVLDAATDLSLQGAASAQAALTVATTASEAASAAIDASISATISAGANIDLSVVADAMVTAQADLRAEVTAAFDGLTDVSQTDASLSASLVVIANGCGCSAP